MTLKLQKSFSTNATGACMATSQQNTYVYLCPIQKVDHMRLEGLDHILRKERNCNISKRNPSTPTKSRRNAFLQTETILQTRRRNIQTRDILSNP